MGIHREVVFIGLIATFIYHMVLALIGFKSSLWHLLVIRLFQLVRALLTQSFEQRHIGPTSIPFELLIDVIGLFNEGHIELLVLVGLSCY